MPPWPPHVYSSSPAYLSKALFWLAISYLSYTYYNALIELSLWTSPCHSKTLKTLPHDPYSVTHVFSSHLSYSSITHFGILNSQPASGSTIHISISISPLVLSITISYKALLTLNQIQICDYSWLLLYLLLQPLNHQILLMKKFQNQIPFDFAHEATTIFIFTQGSLYYLLHPLYPKSLAIL